MTKWAGLVAILAACGGNNNKPPIVIIDSAVPMVDVPIVVMATVTLQSFGSPQFVAYRDGTGPWQTPLADAQGNFTLHVTRDYAWVMVCAQGTTFDAVGGYAMAGDGDQFAFCFVDGGTPPTTVAVTSTMVQPGTVNMSEIVTGTTANWPVTLDVPIGTYDLAAVGASKMILRRSVAVAGAMTLPTIDESTEGTALDVDPLTITNLGGDTLSTEVELATTNGFATLDGTSATLQAPPQALLTANDFEFLDLQATGGTAQRGASTEFTGAETTFDLPAKLAGVTFDGTGSATWGTLPSYTSLDVSLFSATSASSTQSMRVTATQAWIAATHATKLAFDTSATGYDATWKIALNGPYNRAFSAFDDSTTISYSTGFSESVNTPTPIRAMRHPHTLREVRARARR
jgi:hypothetical protein